MHKLNRRQEDRLRQTLLRAFSRALKAAPSRILEQMVDSTRVEAGSLVDLSYLDWGLEDEGLTPMGESDTMVTHAEDTAATKGEQT